VIGAEQGVARSDGHTDEPVSAGRMGPKGRAELTMLAHAAPFSAGGQRAKFCAPGPYQSLVLRLAPSKAMYLATRNKPRKTNRKRSVRNKAKLAAKNRGRRKGLQK
jgi:hypothetical protein